jgi:hypothetical protein
MPVEMTLMFEWEPLGRVGLDPQGKLVFPRAPSRPGLYRFEFDGAKGRQEYIGETDTLNRRFQHYRTPGPSQEHEYPPERTYARGYKLQRRGQRFDHARQS